MAVAIKTEEKTARQDTFLVSAKDVAKGVNSRMIPSANYAEQVKERAADILANGQLQPCEVRRAPDKSLILTFGFTRLDAVELLNEQGHDTKLWVKVVDATEDEAFDRGVSENRQRNDTTDLQEARAQDHYRVKRGLNDTQIAEKYGYTNQNRVMALKKLLTLSPSIQDLVHHGKMSLSAAIDTLKLPEEKREAAVAAATDPETGKVAGPAVRKAARAEKEETAAEGPTEKPKPPTKRTIKDFNEFAAELIGTNETPENVKNLFKTLSAWFADERSDRQLWNAIDRLEK